MDEARLLIGPRPLRTWAWHDHVTWLPPVVCLDVLNTRANFGAIGLLLPDIWPTSDGVIGCPSNTMLLVSPKSLYQMASRAVCLSTAHKCYIQTDHATLSPAIARLHLLKSMRPNNTGRIKSANTFSLHYIPSNIYFLSPASLLSLHFSRYSYSVECRC